MRRLAQIATLVVVALLSACSNKEVVRDTEPIYTPRYAQGFSIERDKASGELLLCVKNPWQGAEGEQFYTLLNVSNPLKRIIAMSSSHAAMLDAIGCADRIVGLSGCQYIYDAELRRAIADGKIGEVGYDASFNFEKMRALNPDIILLYGVAGEAKVITNKLEELRIPYIYIGEYLEESPLGKAEWVVALSYLCGCEEKGKKFFEGVEERYNDLCEQKHCSAYKPRVMLNLPYRDTWFMPPHNSYMVRLIEDAGGEYILKSRDERRETKEQNAKLDKANGQKPMAKSQNSSTPISLEEALVLAMKADFWLNLGQMASVEEVCAATPRFAKVDAVRFGRLYNNTKRTNESRGSDFWESGAVRPDLILQDLVKILHHEAPTEELYYYKKLGERR